MRVAILKSRLSFRGGLEKYTLRLAKAFQARGCEVTLLTTGTPPLLDGIQTHSLGKDSKFSLHHIKEFDQATFSFLQHYPHEVVFGMERTSHQTHYRAGSGVHAVYLQQRKLTDSILKRLSFKINPLHRTLLKIERSTFENPDLKLLFTNSNQVREEILSHFDVHPEKILTVHNGVEWEEWELPFQKSFSKSREEPFHFLFIGNGYRRKGLLFLLEGLASLPTRAWKLSVVGRESHLSLFQKEAERLKIAHQISFKGELSDVRPLYQAADALVIPSIYDPFANVTVEALAMGLFVVSSRYNGGREILTPESGCVIEDLTSPSSVARALQKALLFPKTKERAQTIRQTVKRLDFSHALHTIVEHTLYQSG